MLNQGKNDGCVAGKRYFQCEPKRGIFSRLTRLTLAPLAVGGSNFGGSGATPTSPISKHSPDHSRGGSPTASMRSSILRGPGSKFSMDFMCPVKSFTVYSFPINLTYNCRKRFDSG